MRRNVFTAVWLAAMAACSAAAPRPAAAPTDVAVDDGAGGMQLALPAGWREAAASGYRLFVPPADDAEQACHTVVWQAQPNAGVGLDAALEGAFAAVTEQPAFRWEQRVPSAVDGHAALFYRARYCHLGVLRRRAGLLLLLREQVVDISYNAPAASFDGGLGAFIALADSLQVPPEDNC